MIHLSITLLTVSFLISLAHLPVEAGRQCISEEKQNLELVKVDSPGRILLETSGVKKKEDCYKACCHASTVGCNAAAYFIRGSVGVCQLVNCNPFSSCIWKPAPHSMVMRIRGMKNLKSGPPGASVILSPTGPVGQPVPKSSPENDQAKNAAKPAKASKTAEANIQKNNIPKKPIHPVAKAPVKTSANKTETKTTNKAAPPKLLGKPGENNKQPPSKTTATTKEPVQTSKGIFDYLRDFLTGKQDTKNENSSLDSGKNKMENSANKVNEEQKAKVNTKQQAKLIPEQKQNIPVKDSIRQRELERAAAAKQNQLKTQQKPAANANVNAKPQPKSNPVVKTAPKKPESAPVSNDDFNIIPLNQGNNANAQAQVQNVKDKDKSVAKTTKNGVTDNKPDVNNNKQLPNQPHHHHEMNRQPSNDQLKQQQLAKQQQQQQLLKQQLLRQQQLRMLDIERRKKSKEDLAKASITALLIGCCTAAMMALIVIVVVCRKVFHDDVAHYRPLRSYDSKGPNDQTQMLLGSGQKITHNSI